MPIPILPFLLLLLHVISPTHSLPGPDPATIHPLTLPPPAVIPAFPEQSAIPDEPCPRLSLPDELIINVKSACGPHASHRTRCCPVLAAWLYSSYSSSALRPPPSNTSSVDVPALPDDSETCVEGVEGRLRARGVGLFRPNETCDLVYCYCGIRLHPLTCPEVFRVNKRGKLVGDRRVRRLERSCSSGGAGDVGRFPGLGGCSKCLTTLSTLTSNKNSTTSKQPDERTTKMHDKDCQLMGLTWLLSKNRTAYIPTVSAVLRAMMMSPDDSNPQSCTLSRDGMPLAADSSQFSGGSASISRLGWTRMSLVLICTHFLCRTVLGK